MPNNPNRTKQGAPQYVSGNRVQRTRRVLGTFAVVNRLTRNNELGNPAGGPAQSNDRGVGAGGGIGSNGSQVSDVS